MKLATRIVSRLGLITAAAVIAGCAPAAVPSPPAAPVVPVAQVSAPPNPPPDEWNLFPDPTTGNVEVYHEGQDVGSVTGDEKEDPPLPHRHDQEDSDPTP